MGQQESATIYIENSKLGYAVFVGALDREAWYFNAE